MRLRKRAVGLVLGASVLFLIGTNVQAGMLFVLAALLLGAVAAGVVLPATALRGLAASMAAPNEAVQGEPTMVGLRLENRGRGMRWSVVASDPHLEAAEVFVGSIRPGETIEATTLRTPARRGSMLTTSVRVRSAAPFGVAERRRTLAVEAHTLVLPRVFPLGALPFIEDVAAGESGMHSAPRRGHGPDYLGAREYRAGDPMRHVHWGLTARHGQVMVREFEQERTRRLAIVVDTERDAGQAWTPLDRICSVAASLVEAAAAAGQGSRLMGCTAGGSIDLVSRVEPGAMHRWLAALEPSGAPLPEVLGHLGSDDLRGADTVVVIFPAWADRDPAQVARALGGLPVSTVVGVALALTDGEGSGGGPAGLAEAFDREGISLHTWDPSEDLGRCLGAEVGG